MPLGLQRARPLQSVPVLGAIGLLLAGLAAAEPASPAGPTETPATAPPTTPYCPGEYADDYGALLPKVRDFEQQLPAYTFCIRTAATYECPSYGPDGSLRRKRRRVVAHGTGFAYRQQAGETLLLTNQHVAEWPAVTDEDHPVDDVPPGCKRVADSLKIVDGDSDSYERDDIALSRVVVDPQLDIAVLKAKAQLPILPWKIGHSAGLRDRNVVDVRGFPLGVFKATNVGKVVSTYDHDGYKDWDHDDFVVDALLSQGNSGSPVFAISCRTGEFELVGVYHAGYTRGSALNVVIGIDQVRDMMTTLQRVARPRPDSSIALDAASRERLFAAAKASFEPFFPLGPLTAAVRTRDDGVLFFEILNRDFPFRAHPIVVLEDLPPGSPEEFGVPGRVWLGNRQGLKTYSRAELDADTRSLLTRLLDGLRRDSLAALAVRVADHDASSSREKFERTVRLEKALQRASAGLADLAPGTQDLAERLSPQPGEPSLDLQATLALPSLPPADAQAASSAAAAAGSAQNPPPHPAAATTTGPGGGPRTTPKLLDSNH